LADGLRTPDELVVFYNSLSRRPLFGPAVREAPIRLPKATLWNQVGVPYGLRRHGCDVYLGQHRAGVGAGALGGHHP
jgi:hypothetical protein